MKRKFLILLLIGLFSLCGCSNIKNMNTKTTVYDFVVNFNQFIKNVYWLTAEAYNNSLIDRIYPVAVYDKLNNYQIALESTLENNTTFCEVLKSEFIQHRILAISLYILFRKVFIIVTSYNIYFLSSTYLLQNQIDLDWRALRPPICNQTCV